MWRISWSNSIIKWQDYRVAASGLAESNFRYTQGIRDNLGLRLLEAANAEARNRAESVSGSTGFLPQPTWQLDAIVISDGGKFLDTASSTGAFTETCAPSICPGLKPVRSALSNCRMPFPRSCFHRSRFSRLAPTR